MNISMMKKLQWLLLALLLSMAEFAAAQVATVFDLSGAAQAIPGAGAPRALRKGDAVSQGETIVTAEGSAIVLKFDDGQVVALAARSRFTITNYTYNRAEPEKSSVLLSLLQGGMRAVTGLIGKRSPASVNYKAANATIGIRGTDTTIAVDGGTVAVTVADGEISFNFNGQTVSIPVGQGAVTTADGKIQSMPAAQVIAAIRAQSSAASAAIVAALQSASSQAIQNAVSEAVQPGSSGQRGQQGQQSSAPPPTPSSTGNSGSSGSTGTGGGSPSGR